MDSRLQGYDFKLYVDGTGSMVLPTSKDTPTGVLRWNYVQEWAVGLAAVCEEYDPDGLDVYVYGAAHKSPQGVGFKKWSGVTAATMANVFGEVRPFGGTVFAPALRDGFANTDKAKKGTIHVVIGDGAFDDHGDVAQLIIAHTKGMERDEECGILFLQIGLDGDATRALVRLDDDLQRSGAKFDIVDHKNFKDLAGMSPEEILAGALDD